MITLYTFPEAFGLRNVSPFCLTVEMTLAHLGLAHEIAMEFPRLREYAERVQGATGVFARTL